MVCCSVGLGQGHLLPVANLALHPSKPILATASDDKTWKLWHLPHGDLIMCGEGHKDWVAGVDFHPAGTSLASGSGQSVSRQPGHTRSDGPLPTHPGVLVGCG